MPIHFHIDPRAGLVRLTMTGEVSAAEFMAYRRELVAHPSYSPVLPRVLDARAVTLAPDTPEIQQLANAMLWRGVQLLARRAIIADRDALYGMFRMLETMVDLEGGEPVRVFRTEEEALQWCGAA